jgi:hypothetical protein
MLTDQTRWSLGHGKPLVPSRWQATRAVTTPAGRSPSASACDSQRRQHLPQRPRHPSRRARLSRPPFWQVRMGHAAALPVVSTAGLPATVPSADAPPGAFMPVARMVQVIHLA